MKYITFIGNCQLLCLCFFFQQLLPSENYTVKWVCYGKDFERPSKRKWAQKCKNKVYNYDKVIKLIKASDIIIFQEVCPEKSLFCNKKTISSLIHKSCKLLVFPSIHINYRNYKNSLKELQRREKLNKVDITVSDIIIKHEGKNLMVNSTSIKHPGTLFFMEITKKICEKLDLNFFSEQQYEKFIKNNNYMELP